MTKAFVLLVLVFTACGSGDSAGPEANPAGHSEQVVIFTHCGFFETDFDGKLWTPDSIERGDYPEGTGFNATPGVMTRFSDRALFQSDAGIEIWFTLAPDDLPPPPPCD